VEAALHVVQLSIAGQWVMRALASAASKQIVMPPILAACAMGITGTVTAVIGVYCASAQVDGYMWAASRVLLAAYLLPLSELAFVFSSACLLNRLQPSSGSNDSKNMLCEYSYERERRRLQFDPVPSAPPYPPVNRPLSPSRRRRVRFRNALSSPTPSPLSDRSEPPAPDVRRDGYSASNITGVVPTPVETAAYYSL
jgi:hypothetical protein